MYRKSTETDDVAQAQRPPPLTLRQKVTSLLFFAVLFSSLIYAGVALMAGRPA